MRGRGSSAAFLFGEHFPGNYSHLRLHRIFSMYSATALQRAEEVQEPSHSRSKLILVLVMILAPLLAGLAWHYASDDPLWRVFRSSLNLCSLHEAQLSPVSPDGRYRVHVVQATCAARFPETMVFLAEANEPFSLNEVDPNRAVLEVAGHRTLDAAIWQPSAESPQGRMVLHLWTLKGSMPAQLHRFENHWRDVAIELNQSQPAPGAERLAY